MFPIEKSYFKTQVLEEKDLSRLFTSILFADVIDKIFTLKFYKCIRCVEENRSTLRKSFAFALENNAWNTLKSKKRSVKQNLEKVVWKHH